MRRASSSVWLFVCEETKHQFARKKEGDGRPSQPPAPWHSEDYAPTQHNWDHGGTIEGSATHPTITTCSRRTAI